MKDKLTKELEHIRFTRQQHVIEATKPKAKKANWQYRTVLVTFALLTLFFTATFVGDGKSLQTAMQRSENTALQLLGNTYVLIILYFGIVLAIRYAQIRFYERKRATAVVTCPHCGHVLTKRERMKLWLYGTMHGKKCTSCEARYYITRKSTQRTAATYPLTYLAIFVPANIFPNLAVGLFVGFVGALLLVSTAYQAIELQENDPNQEPIKPLW
ncbi:hypothetical protein CH76_11395 [Lysinibacillus sp. BF-4]|uniref:hypothetical protein n=1 Tax=Lysinibacillus sp. BF-4 TaxID=1473546 RepID=UPI000507C8B4|nr:hypothetical protein [Lysinibacillus sp. BF-4]KFL42620.1 hypothetical protein CH76_11395 [Lysinibacillus sp. BF-4]